MLANGRPCPFSSRTDPFNDTCEFADAAKSSAPNKETVLSLIASVFKVCTEEITRVIHFPWQHYPPRFIGYDLSPDFRQGTPLQDGAIVR